MTIHEDFADLWQQKQLTDFLGLKDNPHMKKRMDKFIKKMRKKYGVDYDVAEAATNKHLDEMTVMLNHQILWGGEGEEEIKNDK